MEHEKAFDMYIRTCNRCCNMKYYDAPVKFITWNDYVVVRLLLYLSCCLLSLKLASERGGSKGFVTFEINFK